MFLSENRARPSLEHGQAYTYAWPSITSNFNVSYTRHIKQLKLIRKSECKQTHQMPANHDLLFLKYLAFLYQ